MRRVFPNPKCVLRIEMGLHVQYRVGERQVAGGDLLDSLTIIGKEDSRSINFDFEILVHSDGVGNSGVDFISEKWNDGRERRDGLLKCFATCLMVLRQGVDDAPPWNKTTTHFVFLCVF